MNLLTCTSALDKEEPLLPHLNLGDALSRQVRVDGGELATDKVVTAGICITKAMYRLLAVF